MGNYNYLETIVEDVKEYIKYEAVLEKDDLLYRRESLEEKLYEELWNCDSVTGNASGSYYCNSYKAEEALSHNWDLLAEALREFGEDGTDILERGAEAMDVTIRCYLLGQAISQALDEIEEEFSGSKGA